MRFGYRFASQSLDFGVAEASENDSYLAKSLLALAYTGQVSVRRFGTKSAAW